MAAAAAVAVAKGGGGPKTVAPDPPRYVIAPGAYEHCPGARKGLEFYKRVFTRARASMALRTAPVTVRYGCRATVRRAEEWRDRARAAVRALAQYRHRQFAWWVWMPRGSKWYRVASCETGYGGDPNWSHDSGTYVSAFGIYRPGYADDAHRIGNLSWDETRRLLGRLPTPREQYDAALSHYRANGGFSGWGCRGA